MSTPPNPFEPPSQQSGPHSQPFPQQPAPPYGQPYYGQPAYGQPYYGQPAPPQESGMAIASLICGILGLVACYIFTGIPAVILGHMAMGKAKRGEAGGRGMALAGVILGWISVGLTVLVIAFVVIFGLATDWRFDEQQY